MKTTSTKAKALTVLLTLCMVLSLVPVSAFAATPATQTADFTTDEGAAIALLNAAKTGSEDSTWDSASKTLTLRGIDFTTTATTAMKLPDGATIILADGTENKITGGDATAAETGTNTNKIFVYGIFSNGALTIQGETAGTGTLSVTSGSHTNTGNAWTYSIALYGEGNLMVKGGTVTANGGKATGYDGGFSDGVHLAQGSSISVTGGSLIGIGGESLNSADPSNITKTNSCGIYIYDGNISVSGTGKLVGDCITNMYESELSTGVYILRGLLHVSDSGQVNATGGYGIQITSDGIKLTGGKITATCTATYNSNAISVKKEYYDTGSGNIEVTGGVLETNGNISMYAYNPTDFENIFSITGGTVQTGRICDVNKFNISGGTVRSQKITTNDLTLSNATLTVREPVLMSNSPYTSPTLYTSPALHLKNLTVNSGVLDVAWDWGGYTPIVFPIDSYDQFRTPLVRMWGPSYIATFNGGTTVLDTGCAGNFVIRGQIVLGEGMTQTGADENQFQLSSDTPVKFSSPSSNNNIINEVVISDAKFNYQPGDAPQAAAKISIPDDSNKYEILFESWEQMQNNNPVAYWYSDDSQYTASMNKITQFETGKSYMYSIRLKAKDGYAFADNCPVTINGTTVNAVNVIKTTDGLFITAVKTITPNNSEIKLVEINNATVNFNAGDTPVFTGKVPEGANYSYQCEWWEIDDSKTGVNSEAFWDKNYENHITSFESGKTYRYGIYLKANEGYYFTANTKLKINGVLYDYKRSENDSELTHPDDMATMWVYTGLTLTPQTSGTTTDYKIIEGANGAWTQNTDGTLVFRANGEFSKFTGIMIDGNSVPADKYTAVSGSTIITLKSDYLSTLSVGKHTLSVIYTDGQCSTEFEIKAAQTDGNNSTSDKSNDGNANKSDKLPKTGDSSNLMLQLVLLLFSGSVLTGIAVISKKKKVF
mgnify:CR=1 FL=1